jgi:hypothetical protein
MWRGPWGLLPTVESENSISKQGQSERRFSNIRKWAAIMQVII